MRLIVTGDKDGRACVVRELDCSPPGEGDHPVMTMLDMDLGNLPPRPAGQAKFLDLGIPAGGMRWLRVNLPPHLEVAFHHTDSIDLHTIVAGSIELLLDDGAHNLMVGDSALVAGVDHGWRAGPEGSTSSVVLLGTPPPEPRDTAAKD